MFSYSEQKCIRSQKYASENGLPVLKNVLLPKTKGFCACLEDLRDSLDSGFHLSFLFGRFILIKSYSVLYIRIIEMMETDIVACGRRYSYSTSMPLKVMSWGNF